ncbi:hypothetical protein [Streptomyces sp. HNM0574]|uniref:hypothetical protein n=1 Tax=Streptomyces sp. HNM0574 TaxID=2714954 RepID=UPI00146E1ACF|nr:hypothetical protein [Streptomyces sp. HNM0574]NLU69619.1 hypothetical protein [Streptomyces sp. HNM0574]
MGQMRVDLSELEETVRKLKRVSSAMGDSVTKSKYNTFLPAQALGKEFKEADDLHRAHEEMKDLIQEITRVINGVVNDFGENAKKVHGNYQNAEHDAKHGMDGGQSGSGN